jgi:mRNA interferase HicA
MSEITSMRGNELVRRLRRLARERGVAFELIAERGKGSHVRLHFGDCMTTIPDPRRELKKGLLHGVCRQLGVKVEEL